MLQWTTPAMLAGAALIVLPLVAHWLNRATRRTIVFPTLQFLAAVAAAENRRLKLRRWLLLLLRCLAIFLAVAAFARPVWFYQPTAGPQDAKRLLVVVLDNSVSTTQVANGSTLHSRLLVATQRFLGELTTGRDEALVVLAEARPRLLLRRPTSNLDYLLEELRGLVPTMERADLDAALEFAAAVMAEQPSPVQKQLLVLSDLQLTNWQEQQRIVGRDLRLPANCQLQIVDLELPAAANLGLHRPAALPADPLPGQTCQLSVTVHNYSPQAQQAAVSLQIGDLTLQTQTVALDPWQSQIVSFPHAYDPTEGRQFRFQIPADAMSADNQAFLSLQPSRRVPVALVSDDLIHQAGSSAFFLDRALQPFANELDRFEVKSWRPRDLEPGQLAGFQVVVVGDVRDWTPAAAQELLRFTRAGGRVLYFCGAGPVPRQLETFERTHGEAVFPFLVRDYQRWRRVEQMVTIKQGQWRGRWLREFDLASQFALQQIPFPAAWSVGEIRPDCEVILSYATDRPALAIRSLGSGVILQANLSPSIEAGEFGKYAAFAALVQILVRQLLEEALTSPAQVVGQPLMFETLVPVRAATTTIVDPQGQERDGVEVAAGESLSQRVLEIVDRPGFYSLRVDGQSVETKAVNLEPRESDLRRLSAVTLNELLSQRDAAVVLASAETWPSLLDDGYSLWAWLVVGVMLALLLESTLVGLWRR